MVVVIVVVMVVLLRDYKETTKTKAEIIKDIMRDNPAVSASEIAKKVGIKKWCSVSHKKDESIGGD